MAIILTSIALGYIAFERYVQHQCISMPGYLHNPNPVSLWDCLEYLHDKRTSEINQNDPIRNDRFRVEGKFAGEICAITGGNCPQYYIGNVQEDGSIVVIMTFSDTVKEKQFTFFIKNDTLSYDVKEDESNLEPDLISESTAIHYAYQERNWTGEDFTRYDSNAILLKIKNDGFAFEVDPINLKEKDLYLNRYNQYEQGKYIWLVTLIENKEYQFHIDAATGKTLLVTQDGTVLTVPFGYEDEN